MEKNGFTLIELLAVIAILAIVSVVATQALLPQAGNAREDAFRIEATNVIKAATNAYNSYMLNSVKINNDNNSSINGKVVCFTIYKLVSEGLYDTDTETFEGKVLIDTTNPKSLKYELYFQKSAEFSIVKGAETDYVNKGEVISGGFTGTNDQIAAYKTC